MVLCLLTLRTGTLRSRVSTRIRYPGTANQGERLRVTSRGAVGACTDLGGNEPASLLVLANVRCLSGCLCSGRIEIGSQCDARVWI